MRFSGAYRSRTEAAWKLLTSNPPTSTWLLQEAMALPRTVEIKVQGMPPAFCGGPTKMTQKNPTSKDFKNPTLVGRGASRLMHRPK